MIEANIVLSKKNEKVSVKREDHKGDISVDFKSLGSVRPSVCS